jgi:hypothetical protein
MMLLRGCLGEGLPLSPILPAPPPVGSWGFPKAGKPKKIFAFPFYMPLEIWEALKPGDAMRERRTRTVAKPTIRFRKRAGTSGRLKGCRPSAAFAASNFTGLAPNVTLWSGVGTGQPGSGVGNRVSSQAS